MQIDICILFNTTFNIQNTVILLLIECVYSLCYLLFKYFSAIISNIRHFAALSSVLSFDFPLKKYCTYNRWSTLYWWILLLTTNCRYSIINEKPVTKCHDWSFVSIENTKNNWLKSPTNDKTKFLCFIFPVFSTNTKQTITRFSKSNVISIYWTYLTGISIVTFPYLNQRIIIFLPYSWNCIAPYDDKNHPQSTNPHSQ